MVEEPKISEFREGGWGKTLSPAGSPARQKRGFPKGLAGQEEVPVTLSLGRISRRECGEQRGQFGFRSGYRRQRLL